MSRIATYQFGSPTTEVDSAFYAGIAATSWGNTTTIASQDSTGRFLLTGFFTTRAFVFSSAGVVDTTWRNNLDAQSIFSNQIAYMQANGKTYLCYFDGGVGGTRIIKLNADGTLDSSWTSHYVSGSIGSLSQMAEQSDGKMIWASGATQFDGVTTVNRISRFNADGTIDTTWNSNIGTGPNGNVISVALQSDGKAIVGGSFTTWNGNTRTGIVRLNTDGTEDGTFYSNLGTAFGGFPGSGNPQVVSFVIQPDDKILVSGYFATLNSVSVQCFCRINANGTPDTAFNANLGSGPCGTGVYPGGGIGLQSTGKIVLYGAWPNWNSAAPNRSIRLNSDGTPDYAFACALGTGYNSGNSANFYPNSGVFIQADDKIVYASGFTVINGTARAKGVNRSGVDGGTPGAASWTVPAGVTKIWAQPVDGSGNPIGPTQSFDVVPGTVLYKLDPNDYNDTFVGLPGDNVVTSLCTASTVLMSYGGGAEFAGPTFKIGWVE